MPDVLKSFTKAAAKDPYLTEVDHLKRSQVDTEFIRAQATLSDLCQRKAQSKDELNGACLNFLDIPIMNDVFDMFVIDCFFLLHYFDLSLSCLGVDLDNSMTSPKPPSQDH